MRLIRLLAILTLAMAAFAADPSGKWKAVYQGDSGPMDITYSLKVDGGKLTGTVTIPDGEYPISDGKVDGDIVTFTVVTAERKVPHKGTLAGDEMKLSVNYDEQIIELTAKRVTP